MDNIRFSHVDNATADQIRSVVGDPDCSRQLGLLAPKFTKTRNLTEQMTEGTIDMFNKASTAVALTASALLSAAALTIATPAIADAHLDATDDVYWALTLDLADGQDTVFTELMADMVAATRQEAGAKSYEWHRVGNEVHIIERYETNGDAGIHLGNFGANFAERFMAILTPTGLRVYGPAAGGVREGLAGFGAVFYDQVGGFTR